MPHSQNSGGILNTIRLGNAIERFVSIGLFVLLFNFLGSSLTLFPGFVTVTAGSSRLNLILLTVSWFYNAL